MTVYVDDMRAPFGQMLMCHMVADSTAELQAMADRIGVSRRWIQHPGTDREHFDICLSKRRLAVQAGAVEVSARDLCVLSWPTRGAVPGRDRTREVARRVSVTGNVSTTAEGRETP